MRTSKRKWLIVGSGVALVVIVVLLLRMLAALAFPTGTTDVAQYQTKLGEWRPTGLVDHFPNAIPNNAVDVRFSALPKFLQGGGHFQLRMKVPESEIASFEQKHAAMAIVLIQDGEETALNGATPPEDVRRPGFHTTDDSSYIVPRFPDGYMHYVLYQEGGGNHGTSYGVSLSTAAREIVYWTEWW
jgi:hypothetical protein